MSSDTKEMAAIEFHLKALRAKKFVHSGTMVDKTCPKCGKRIMKNHLGHEWCSNFDCDYFFRNNAIVLPKYIKQLNIKYAKSE
jgi:uncharacterized Zn finger protein (UPF0148 family)